MTTGRYPEADSCKAADRSSLAALRLALADEGEERRRASLYRDLLRRGEGDLPVPGAAEAAPPLQRGRMAPERMEARTAGGALEALLRLALRMTAALPARRSGEGG